MIVVVDLLFVETWATAQIEPSFVFSCGSVVYRANHLDRENNDAVPICVGPRDD
jgi:hypothetical protein